MTTVIKAEIQKLFFDRPGIIRAADRAMVTALARTGRFTRADFRRNIFRRRKSPSKPGRPPNVHSTDRYANLRNVLYGLGPDRRSIIIGPVYISTRAAKLLRKSGISDSLPEFLETGGAQTIRYYYLKGRPIKLWDNAPKGLPLQTRRVRYAPRPFVAMARQRNAPKLAEFLKTPDLNRQRRHKL